MLKVLRSAQRHLNTTVWANASFALLIVTYILVGLRAANSIWFTMDEGSYLFKGFWFLTGQASPFVINGPIANKPPLAFLIPGLSQLVQPGIASGRMMNVLLLAATLLGMWLIIRRRHNAWWGNLAILLVLINPAWVEYYTRVMTQTPAIFLMIWSIYFVTSDRADLPRLTLSATISVLLILTRHNLAPYAVLLFLFMAWQYSLKRAILAFVPGVALFILINAYYWPGIFTLLWYRSLPSAFGDVLLQWFNLAAPVLGGNKLQAVDHSPIQIVQELFGSARVSLVACLMALSALTLIKKSSQLAEAKLFVFLTANFWVLTLVHVSVVFDKNVLLYSYPAYLLFWAPTIFILLPNIAELIRTSVSSRKAWWLLGAFVSLCGGIAMHHYREIADPVLNLFIPRVRGLSLQPGSVELWRVIVNKFEIDYRAQEYLVPALTGLLAGLAFIGIALLLSRRTSKPVWTAFALLVTLSVFFTPTRVLSGSNRDDDCRLNTLAAIQQLGDQINAQVKPGALFFWGAHSKPTVGIMLYVDEARVFPEQLNGQFYYRPEISLEDSQNSIFWSDEQARVWLREADYLISDPGHLIYWDEMLQEMPDVKVDQLKPTNALEPCDPSTRLYIYELAHE